jgi:4-alpha-glucanotransferase
MIDLDSHSTGRASGLLLHPTSLPGPYGCGDLGESALRFLDYLAEAGQSLWQVLPLGPTGFGDSPYACFSSFAGNPLLVSIDALRDQGLIAASDLASRPAFSPGRISYGPLISWKLPLLRAAARRYLAAAGPRESAALGRFRADQGRWLSDYCLFMAIKRRYDETTRTPDAWNRAWEIDIARREPRAMARWTEAVAREVQEEEVIQLFFFSQWSSVRAAAVARGIRVIGDLPIFVAPDSADVWANRELFLLDSSSRPTAVSGVPPDYFAATGQLWGNPLYDWPALARQGYRFWIQRIGAACGLFDFVRIDHFRGFEACWSVPAGDATAENGRWVKVPGRELFDALQKELGRLPIIAEDLGVITPEVTALRERLRFPGMRILQFGFDAAEAGTLSPENRFLPHNHTADSIVYTGTHDNDTTLGWWENRSPAERDYLLRYAASAEPEINWKLIRMAMASVCAFAVIPLQDVLGLGSEARMNTPGTSGGGNWCWRMDERSWDRPAAVRLRALSEMYGRA